jgi:hypothetical protein
MFCGYECRFYFKQKIAKRLNHSSPDIFFKIQNLFNLKEEVAQTSYTSLIFQKSILPDLAPSLGYELLAALC